MPSTDMSRMDTVPRGRPQVAVCNLRVEARGKRRLELSANDSARLAKAYLA